MLTRVIRSRAASLAPTRAFSSASSLPLSAVLSRPGTATLAARVSGRNVLARRTLVAAPTPGGGPLMERRPDRELPEVVHSSRRWLRTMPIFIAIVTVCTLSIFNYQKSSSSVVSATLYALRTNAQAREYLGDEIYFASQMPWIWGQMNQLHGRIDIHFDVKGKKNRGTMRFKSERKTRQGVWETLEWTLERSKDAGGGKIDLLDASDPFKTLEFDDEQQTTPGRGLYSPSKEV